MANHLAAALPPGLRLHLRRRYYLRIVKGYRESDWEWSPFIKPLVPPGSLVFDIGANVGYLSSLFARWVGQEGQVISVEPIPDTFDALFKSMKKLFPKTVTCFQTCVSDCPGQATMTVPQYAEGGANYYGSSIVGSSHQPGPNQFTVPATTLDLLTEQHNPDFIKIDVEGHELAVIRGGAGFLSKCHPPLLIEVAGDPDKENSEAEELFALLASWGYQPHLVENGKLRPRQRSDYSVDYLFIFE